MGAFTLVSTDNRKSATSHENSPVRKALLLLNYLARSPKAVSLAELSRALDLPKPTSHRLALMLSELGFVEKDALNARYSIGSGFEEIALNALRNGAGSSARRSLMDGLSERLGVRTNFVVLKAGKLLYVEWVESTSTLRIDVRPGTQIPVHCSASGKLLMAFAPASLRERFLKTAPFPPYTRSTITTARAFARELEAIRRRGHAEDDEEFIPGVCCLAVPVRDQGGDVVAGLAVMAPEASFPLSKARQHLGDIRDCADAISQALGWGHPAGEQIAVQRAEGPTARPKRTAASRERSGADKPKRIRSTSSTRSRAVDSSA
jgi:DNA-binding IclR family transcriptional regulator